MNGEISILGVYLPTILLLAIIASPVTMILMRLADLAGVYRIFSYRALVDLSLYVLVLGGLSLLFPLLGFQP